MTRMEKVEAGLSFGPFKTAHHNAVVNERFRVSFLEWVKERVLLEVEGEFDAVEGKVTSHYDDEKFFGPRSILKYRYYYDIHFHSVEGSERAWGELEYDQENGGFVSTRKVGPCVQTLSLKRKLDDMVKQAKEIGDRYRAGERNIRCPYCGCDLRIWFIEERNVLKDISCPSANCFGIHFD